MPESVTLCYLHKKAVGYGRLGVELHAALEAQGVTVHDRLATPADKQDEFAKAIEKAVNDGSHEAPLAAQDAAVCWVTFPTHARGWWAGQAPMVYTMYETTMLPEGFRDCLDNFERIFVPSAQNVELFSRYHRDVRLVPLGINPQVWHFTPRPAYDSTFFRFLIGGSGARKGTDLAFDAFAKAFGGWFSGSDYLGPTDKPIPQLVMKNPAGESFDAPWLTKITGRITDQEEVDLYANAHVYLQPSRGEGFGLQPLQAMAQGCPTILTNAHGHAAFAELGVPLDAKLAKASYFMFGESGEWWEPDLDQLCEAMWDTFQNYPDHQARAAAVAAIVGRKFSWSQVATNFRREAADYLNAAPVAAGEWVEPESLVFKVVVNKTWGGDIGDRAVRYEPGREYWEPADIKRILFEAGLLHPDCLGLDDDLGLNPRQVESLTSDSGAHAYCPTCHQQYNSGITKSDAIYEELVQAAGG